MPNLEVCSLSVNGITTLKDFSYCQNLQELYIRKNAIENLSEICHLKTLPKLRSLWIADNPCCNRKNYRSTVLRHLPNLQKLDNIAVTEDEVNAAVEEGDDLWLTDSLTSKQSRNGSEPESETTDDEPSTDDSSKGKDSRLNEVVTLTMEETNKIRAQLGLKPLPQDKMTPPKSVASGTTKSRNSHILQAVLLLIKELDSESLEVVGNAVKNRLESL
ncbi:cilia- and flagella-associated protein 410-like isoform X2 [Liolophura sinensis]